MTMKTERWSNDERFWTINERKMSKRLLIYA